MEVAVLIPCHNEAGSIGGVVSALLLECPAARVVVCDNGSSDDTAVLARAAGAEVMLEPRLGKGNAMRRLFRDVQADVYVMIDGDHTYGTEILPEAIALVSQHGCDMVVGTRKFSAIRQRPGHDLGNYLFTRFFQTLFGVKSADVFSGLRVLSHRLVKTFPCVSLEFEIEAELEIYCARMLLPTASLPVTIRPRLGSASKLNTLRDGFKILWLALRMLHREYPLRLYGVGAAAFSVLAIVLLTPVLSEYMQTGLVPRFPTLIVGSALMVLSLASLGMGLVLKEITNSRYEARYLRYLSFRR
ncbi:MAG: glycosyltransferase family 2 protein [Cyanobacteriota bacterium]|nr:glycosyltransferase family 2 protein [Cyanobacteriota bacterium]